MSRYSQAALRIQQAIMTLIASDKFFAGAEPRHLKVSVELTRADLDGLVNLLVDKGVLSKSEYRDAIGRSAEAEAYALEIKVKALKAPAA